MRDLEKELEDSLEDAGLNSKADEAKKRSMQLASKLETERDSIAQQKSVQKSSFAIFLKQ